MQDKPVALVTVTRAMRAQTIEAAREALLGADGPTGTFTRWENVTISW